MSTMTCDGRHWARAAASGLLWVVACGGPKAEPVAAPVAAAATLSVPHQVVATRPMPQSLPMPATLVADREAKVAANVSGRVTEVFIERGRAVAMGAPLAQVDRRGATFTEAEAQANLTTALAQERLAASQCKRNEALLERGAITRDEWERIDSQCRTSQAAAVAARARAEQSRSTLSDSKVVAPFAGRIFDKLVNVGEYVQPSTQVAHLVATDPVRVRLTVAERDLGRVAMDMRVGLRVDALPDEQFEGVVRYLDPALREATRDMRVEAVVANPKGALLPGMSARAWLVLPPREVVCVATDAIRGGGLDARLFVVADGRVQERRVRTGATEAGFVEIRAGLRVGEQVVSPLSDAVKDGLPVASP